MRVPLTPILTERTRFRYKSLRRQALLRAERLEKQGLHGQAALERDFARQIDAQFEKYPFPHTRKQGS